MAIASLPHCRGFYILYAEDDLYDLLYGRQPDCHVLPFPLRERRDLRHGVDGHRLLAHEVFPFMRPIVAIVGRPNVGKSTLFNRLVGFRKAIVESIPGVTRDLNYADVNRFERPLTFIDTGGFEPAAQDELLLQRAEQCRLAVEEADCIIFLLDGKEGLTPSDREIAGLLREGGKKVLYAVNKIDGPTHEGRIYDFYGLGVETLYPLSAQHNYGIARLIEAIIELIPPPDSEEE